MFSFFLRSIWRLIIFAIGAALVYATVEIFPYVDGRLALFLALLITYCVFAYLIIPALFRLYHVIIEHDHIPLYVTTRDGWASDPVTLAVVAKDKNHLEKIMHKAGWYTADELTFKNGIREVISIIFDRPYPEAPMSHLYLFDRPHDIGFEIPTTKSKSARTRHHVRFWRLQEPGLNAKNAMHFQFWTEKLQHLFTPKREIWIGAATEETKAIDFQWRTGRITHGGSHESDKERDFIIQTLIDTNKTTGKIFESEPGDELRFRGQQFRTFYVSDGSIKIVRLK